MGIDRKFVSTQDCVGDTALKAGEIDPEGLAIEWHYLSKEFQVLRLGSEVRRSVTQARDARSALATEQFHQCSGELLEASSDLILLCDCGGRLTYINANACRLLGKSSEQLIGESWHALYTPHCRRRLREQVMRVVDRAGHWQGDSVICAARGATIPVTQVVTAHKQDGQTHSYSVIARDLRVRKAYEARIHQLQYHDALTGLPTVERVHTLVRRMIVQARRSAQVIALVSLNLDRFRLVDEGFGRTLGDDVLKSAAAILRAAVRDHDLVARLGADGFLVILSQLAVPADASELVQRMQDLIATPHTFAGHKLRITASAGIATYPADGEAFEELLRNANAAMHYAKTVSRGALQFHSGDVERLARRRLQLENSLSYAIQHHELTLHYQPQYEIQTGALCGIEALARWNHPSGEPITASEFIPLAEQTGLIVSLGDWVLQEACETICGWNDSPPRLCINVSPLQLGNEFVLTVRRLLSSTGFSPARLELEVTENALIADPKLSLECLLELKQLGVRIALDDFGTGYSSLSYLSRLPVDRLKIDKSLILSMTSERKDAAIVRSIIVIGEALGLPILAEGVETEQQLEMLEALGCDQVQGFLLSPPVPAAQARLLLRQPWGIRKVPPHTSIHENIETHYAS